MKHKICSNPLVSGLVCCFALAVSGPSARAAEAPPALPDGFSMHCSVRSLAETVAALEIFGVAATRDMPFGIPPGAFTKVGRDRMPLGDIPALDRDLHILFGRDGDRPADRHIVIFPADGLEGFGEVMARLGIAVSGNPEAGIVRISPPLLGEYTGVPFSDTHIMLADSPGMLKLGERLRDAGWRPRHWADGDICLDVPIRQEWFRRLAGGAEVEKTLLAAIARSRTMAERALGNRRDLGIEERQPLLELRLAALDAAEQAVPALAAELSGLRHAAAVLDLRGERLALSLLLFADPETRLGQSAALAAAGENIDFPMLKNAGREAQIVAANVSPGGMLPGLGTALAELLNGVAERAFPERSAALAANLRDIIEFSDGNRVYAQYYVGDEDYNAVWLGSPDPGRAVASYASLIGTLEGMVATMTDEPEKYFRFEVEEVKTTAGNTATLFNFTPELLRVVFGQAGGAFYRDGDKPGEHAAYYSLTAAGEQEVVTIYGSAGGDELDVALGAIGGVPDPLWETGPVAAALVPLPNRQYAAAVMNAGCAFRGILGRAIARQTRNFSRIHLPLVENRIYNAARDHFRDTEDLAAFSLGGDNGALIAGMSVSAEFVNVLLHSLSFRNPKALEAVNKELEDTEWARNALRPWLGFWRR